MPQYGSFLSASTGKWSGVPISFSYQWFRCNNSGASCSIIAGATAQSYALLAPADTGATFRVTVVASNAKGSASAQSGASGVVAAASSPFAVGSSLSNGSTVGGTIQWDATPGVTVNFAQFYIDGVLVQTVSSSPYRFNQSGNGLLDTTQLTNGSHIFGIRALSTDNRTYGFSSVTMTVSNGTTNSAPTVVSVTPSSGSASNQTFAFVYADPNGFADLSFAQVNIATTLSAANACYVHYDRASNSAYLVNDAGTTGIGPVVLGSAGSAQNSQCVLNGTGSSAVGSGNNLTVTLALTFKPAFAGSKVVNLYAQDVGGLGSGFQQMGTWSVTTTGNLPPTVVSVTPSSGSGSSQTFAFVYADPNGFADLSFAQANIATTLSAANACYVHYDRASNSAYLINDAGTTGIGPVVLGSAGSAQNSQCVLNGTGSSAVGSGNNLTVTLALTFKPAFAGSKVVNLYAQDVGGLGSGFQQMGTWSAQ
jgi:hypothetical protein